MDMRIAVLGGTGFIGSVIVDHLSSRGYDVIPVTRKDVTLTDYASVDAWLRKTHPYAIVNCATSGGKQRMGDALLEDVQNNISLFMNFLQNSEHFDRFVNIGSGAEFDWTTNIDLAREEDIMKVWPADGYGYSKNTIARLCLTNEKFTTLRLFGCFDHREPDFRLFKKFIRRESMSLADRYFDYISSRDFNTVLEWHLTNPIVHKDMNCVYQKKYRISEILGHFRPVVIDDLNEKNYTGDGSKLAGLNIPLLGLEESIKEYKCARSLI